MTAASRRARAEAVSGRRAGLLSRLLADGVDFVIVVALFFGLLVAFAAVRYLIEGGSFRLPQDGTLVNAVLFPIVAIVYLTLMWHTSGRSIGKNLLGLRVVRGDGTPMGFWRSAFRATWCVIIGFLSLVWVAISRRNLAAHDIVFRTAVVHDWPNVVHWTPPVAVGTLEESA